MKKIHLLALLLGLVLASCSSSQHVLNSWKAPAAGNLKYRKIFLVALTDDQDVRRYLEDRMASSLEKLKIESAKSYEVLPELGLKLQPTQKEHFINEIKETGSDAVFTITLLDVLTTEKYTPPYVSPPSGTLVFYNHFYTYYYHRYPLIYNPGYFTTDRSYLTESNLYDLAEEKLVWTVQSEAVNPTNLKTWFNGYSSMLIKQLRKDGLLKR